MVLSEGGRCVVEVLTTRGFLALTQAQREAIRPVRIRPPRPGDAISGALTVEMLRSACDLVAR